MAALLFSGLFVHSFLWFAVIALLAFGASIEFGLMHFRGKLPTLGALLFLSSLAFPLNAYLRGIDSYYVPDNVLIGGFFIAIPILYIIRSGSVERLKTLIPIALFGIIWIGYLLSFCINVYFFRLNGAPYGQQAMLLFMVLLASADSGAYVIGKGWGKHQLSPLYSPKKTWEGVIGGFTLSLIMGTVAKFSFVHMIPLKHVLIMSVLCSVFALFGDLAESGLKRSFNVKDASTVLPGHGGVLDRIDSVIFAVPVYYWYLTYVVA
jgi:phosphatidate cytidylyltransferase